MFTPETELVKRKVLQLIRLETQLQKVLDSLDLDINQTDIEWMHFKSLIDSNSQPQAEVLTKRPTSLKGKDRMVIDNKFDAVNLTELDLKPLPQMQLPVNNNEEEFDSD